MITMSAMVAGCMLGPNFHVPASPQVEGYTKRPLPAQTVSTRSAGESGKSQQFITGADIPVEWWTLFHSRSLDALIRTGMANSPNLGAAYAALRQAQEALNVQVGNSLLPAFDAQLGGQRQRFAGSSIGSTTSSIFNLFNANVNVSYTLDLFGAARRQVEAAAAQVDYQQFQLIGAYLAMTANIVTTTVNVASLQAQINATNALLRQQEEVLSILQKQFNLGGISYENVLTQQTLVAQTQALIPPLQKSLSQSLHALSVLVGDFPNGPIPVIKLDDLTLPAHIPVSLPSLLVEQRPDVRASEALLHAANAQIGVATANLFPQFTLTGNYGYTSGFLSNLLASNNQAWMWGGQLTQPIFHGGALRAQRRAAIAAYDQARAQYRQTVLQAFQNVADALRAIEVDARALRAQKNAEVAARNNLVLTRNQYHLGGASYLNLLNAQQQYEQTVISRIQAQAARYSDTAALFQALGGGWWNRPWCTPQSIIRCGK